MDADQDQLASIPLRMIRIVIGLLIPLPFLLLAWVGMAVNNQYFRETFDPLEYWLTSMIWNGPLMLGGAFVMFFRFRSARAGRIACSIGTIALACIAVFFWWQP